MTLQGGWPKQDQGNGGLRIVGLQRKWLQAYVVWLQAYGFRLMASDFRLQLIKQTFAPRVAMTVTAMYGD